MEQIGLGIRARNVISYELFNILHSTYHLSMRLLQDDTNFHFPDNMNKTGQLKIKVDAMNRLYENMGKIRNALNTIMIVFFTDNLVFVSQIIFDTHIDDIVQQFETCIKDVYNIENLPPQDKLFFKLHAFRNGLKHNLRFYSNRLALYSMFGHTSQVNIDIFIGMTTRSFTTGLRERVYHGPLD
jgi:hypothetical protein